MGERFDSEEGVGMDFTRRGFMGFLAAAPVAAVVPWKAIKPTPFEKALSESDKDMPTFPFDVRTGPPFEAGDVVMLKNMHPTRPYLIKAQPKPSRFLFGMRGTGMAE